MEDLQIDWQQERPNNSQVLDMWKFVNILPDDNWTISAKLLVEKITETHSNGGIKLHKYKIEGNKHFNWFASRNRLEEIEFPKNVLGHKALEACRNSLEINESEPKSSIIKYTTDMYDLPGQLSRIMGYGGAYNKITSGKAWEIATNFIKDAFQNRFEEIVCFNISIENAGWFYDIAWDYSTILFDKRNNEITFINITDTD